MTTTATDCDLHPPKIPHINVELAQPLKNKQMRDRRFTEAQIIGMIKEHEAGRPTAEVCRGHGPSPASFYMLKSKYSGIDV